MEAAIVSLLAQPTDIQLAVESVCSWRWMTDLCTETGLAVRVANTIKLRQIADSGQKTDKNDALTIASGLS